MEYDGNDDLILGMDNIVQGHELRDMLWVESSAKLVKEEWRMRSTHDLWLYCILHVIRGSENSTTHQFPLYLAGSIMLILVL